MKVCKIWLVLVLATGLGGIAFGQSVTDSRVVQPEHVLERQVAIRGLEKITIERAFREAMSSGNVPGGIVLPGACAKEDEHQLDIASTTLRDVLDSIVSAAPSYRWQYRHGVVNLIEVKDGTALLGLRIKRFEVKNAKTLSGAFNELMNLNEVRLRLEEVNITQVKHELGLTDLRRSDSGADGDTQGFSVSCSNVTFREALNAIVRANGRGVWSYLERHCNGRDEIRINFTVHGRSDLGAGLAILQFFAEFGCRTCNKCNSQQAEASVVGDGQVSKYCGFAETRGANKGIVGNAHRGLNREERIAESQARHYFTTLNL